MFFDIQTKISILVKNHNKVIASCTSNGFPILIRIYSVLLLISGVNGPGLDESHFQLGPYHFSQHKGGVASKNMTLVCFWYIGYVMWEEGGL